MSKISLKSSSSGTATFTIESPSTNTDRVLVLPDVAGTVALTTDIPAAYTDTDALDLFNASGSAPVFACRAFVNFNGTGTVAIRASGNVSSVARNATGNNTVNFTTAMPDANYASSGSIGDFISFSTRDGLTFGHRAVGSVTCYSGSSSGVAQDREVISVQIFR